MIYGYDVCGTNGVRHSVPSDIVKVVDKGIMGVDKIDTEVKDAPTVIYNLQGIPMSRDLHDLPSGIYIFNGKKISI